MAAVLKGEVVETEIAPVCFNLHVVATLNVTAADARRRVNREVVTELGTGLVGRYPDLVVEGERIYWRVPIVLSLPGWGDLGQVGCVDVDTDSGEIISDEAIQKGIVEHARRLYAGATLPTE